MMVITPLRLRVIHNSLAFLSAYQSFDPDDGSGRGKSRMRLRNFADT